MSEFNKAFVKFIEFFLSYKSKYHEFNGNVLGGFKKNSHAQYYAVLKKELTGDITIDTVLNDLTFLLTLTQ